VLAETFLCGNILIKICVIFGNGLHYKRKCTIRIGRYLPGTCCMFIISKNARIKEKIENTINDDPNVAINKCLVITQPVYFKVNIFANVSIFDTCTILNVELLVSK
jgi:hypothetical protein